MADMVNLAIQLVLGNPLAQLSLQQTCRRASKRTYHLHGSWNPNSPLQACVANALLTEPSPQATPSFLSSILPTFLPPFPSSLPACLPPSPCLIIYKMVPILFDVHRMAAVTPAVLQSPERHLPSPKNSILFHKQMNQVPSKELREGEANGWPVRKNNWLALECHGYDFF